MTFSDPEVKEEEEGAPSRTKVGGGAFQTPVGWTLCC